MSKLVKFTIECEMEEEWKNIFISMLKQMEMLGSIGSTRTVSIISDGDGNFRPKFTPNIYYENVTPREEKNGDTTFDYDRECYNREFGYTDKSEHIDDSVKRLTITKEKFNQRLQIASNNVHNYRKMRE